MRCRRRTLLFVLAGMHDRRRSLRYRRIWPAGRLATLHQMCLPGRLPARYLTSPKDPAYPCGAIERGRAVGDWNRVAFASRETSTASTRQSSPPKKWDVWASPSGP
jgi:hypothetical protein